MPTVLYHCFEGIQASICLLYISQVIQMNNNYPHSYEKHGKIN